ncbi:hypothetical protein N7516_011094 [Penicillium verrucosum]|uniref:uncharacterized protein n=1 Tax=Penicillium verrucosum TaxID=60171 RepID=UPI0025456AA0|nr:uncharacterized protein N7516_011094 [Penicillium verrucosum]KAJ5920236.1 hypothetical protein N7516_011094 [Penicillium verrucosum]
MAGMAIVGEMTGMETKLESDRKTNDLQQYRYLKSCAISPESSYNLIEIEESLREVVQEEISIKEGNATPGINTEERLRILNTEYWLLS